MDASASRVCLFGEDLIAVRLRGSPSTSSERQPIHLIFVIDISSSMDAKDASGTHSKLDHVKQSMHFLLPLLLPTDSLSLVTFGDDATIEIENQLATPEGKSLLEHAIRNLKTDGCTNMSAGLLQMRVVARGTAQHQKPGALLLTDGLANRGISNRSELCRVTEDLLTDIPSLTLTTVGYGLDHDAQLLQDLARTGSGSYNIVNSLEHVASVFGEVFGGLTSVVAQTVSLKIPEGYTPMTNYIWKDAKRTIQVGDIYAENDIIVLLKPESTAYPAIRVEGVDMSSLDAIQLDVIPSTDRISDEYEKDILLAYFRYEVASVLRNPGSRENQAKARDLQAFLRTLPYAEELLVQMMLDDLEHVLTIPSGSRRRDVNTTLLQHSAYLSLGRGLRSDLAEEPTTTHFGHHNPGDVSPPVASPLTRTRSNALNAVASPFSNRVQVQATQSMREASQSTPY
jgi:Mg-chelatase subunit ChlD